MKEPGARGLDVGEEAGEEVKRFCRQKREL